MPRFSPAHPGATEPGRLSTVLAGRPLFLSSTVPVAPGITYSHFAFGTSAGPLSVHLLRLNLDDRRVRLGVGLAHNRLISDNETVSSMVRRSGAVAGVNGDYFDIDNSGMPLNIVVKDGRLLRSPSGRVALAIVKDGRAKIVRYRWAGSIVFPKTRQSYSLAGLNTGLVANAIVALSNDRGYGAPAPGPGMRQTVVELAPVVTSRSDFSGVVLRAGRPSRDNGVAYAVRRVWPQEAYYAPFPRGEMLLVGRGRAAHCLLRHATAGTLVQVNLTTAPGWHDLSAAIGGGPLLVEHGRIIQDPYPPVPHERNQRHPVGAVGISRDGWRMLLVSVDGRQARLSIGLTQPQLAAYAQWLGSYQAMAFDSGGSVTMVVRLPARRTPIVVNSPSDGHERRVADALLIFRRESMAGGPAGHFCLMGRPPRSSTC